MCVYKSIVQLERASKRRFGELELFLFLERVALTYPSRAVLGVLFNRVSIAPRCFLPCPQLSSERRSFSRRLWRSQLIRSHANGAEDPVLRVGLVSPCFQGSSPTQVVGQAFGGDAVEAAHPFLEAAVIGVDVV